MRSSLRFSAIISSVRRAIQRRASSVDRSSWTRVARACRAAHDLGYRRLEYALVGESNEASKSTIARFGGKLCRTFGVYRKELR